MKASKVEVAVLVDDYAGYDVRGLLGQHGLSVLIHVQSAAGKDEYFMLDTGQGGKVLMHNAELMKLSQELSRVKAVALSHCHYDHSGGLLEVIDAVRGSQGRVVPLIAHPAVFRKALFISEYRKALDIGIPFTREELERRGYDLLLVRSPLEIGDGIWWLGEIPRVTEFEGRPKGFYTLSEDGDVIPDNLVDDTAIAIKVEGVGAVVITGCSHAGIVNIVEHASKVTNDVVKVVIGGLHLVSADDRIINETVKALRNAGVEEVWVGHCTGLRAEARLLEEYGKHFRKIHSGFRAVIEGR